MAPIPPRTGHDLPIAQHGLIGDGVTAALVRVDGAIDWLCAPRFDSPSVFAEILDPRAGVCAISPRAAQDEEYSSIQRYEPGTNILETVFTIPGQGVARLIDFMPWPRAEGSPQSGVIHRIVECIEGRADLRATFDPRWSYGASRPELSVDVRGARGSSADLTISAALDRDGGWSPRPEGGVEQDLSLGRGERATLTIAWREPSDGAPTSSGDSAQDKLQDTRKAWKQWSSRLRYEGPWRQLVERSALALKLLIHAPTGAMIAAPTMGLPEWIGGQRNWDYRYAWVRDAALGIQALNRVGFTQEAGAYFGFIEDVLRTGRGLDLMATVDGAAVPEERVLGHLRGYRGSTPVRVGNGAKAQRQLDISGYLVDAALTYERSGGTLTVAMRRHLCTIVDSLCEQWREPDHGIWEPRDGMHHNVHSKVMCWVAFDRASRLADSWGAADSATKWREEASAVRADVVQHGRAPTPSDNAPFVGFYGADHTDAALLLMPCYGFLPGDNAAVRATIERVRADLVADGFVHRYTIDDGVGGAEGGFVLCGFWLAEALAVCGRLEDARSVFEHHANAANAAGLLAEEIDPATGAALGNFPQGFSHMGLINAAVRFAQIGQTGV